MSHAEEKYNLMQKLEQIQEYFRDKGNIKNHTEVCYAYNDIPPYRPGPEFQRHKVTTEYVTVELKYDSPNLKDPFNGKEISKVTFEYLPRTKSLIANCGSSGLRGKEWNISRLVVNWDIGDGQRYRFVDGALNPKRPLFLDGMKPDGEFDQFSVIYPRGDVRNIPIKMNKDDVPDLNKKYTHFIDWIFNTHVNDYIIKKYAPYGGY